VDVLKIGYVLGDGKVLLERRPVMEFVCRRYERVEVTAVRRPYSITVGRSPVCGNGGKTYNPCRVERVLVEWLKARASCGQEYLTGVVVHGEEVFLWKSDEGPISEVKAVSVFSGEVSEHCSKPQAFDSEVEAMLEELAVRLGEALGQVRVGMAYRSKAWDVQLDVE
jgi:hypothetical protein